MKLIIIFFQHVKLTRLTQQQNARHAIMQGNVQNAMLNMWQMMALAKVNYPNKLAVNKIS